MVAGGAELPPPAPAPAPPLPPAPAPAPPPAPPPAPAADRLDLFGEWQVAAMETPLLSPGQRGTGDPTDIAFLIGVGTIQAHSQCVPFRFRYRRAAERLEVTAERWPGPVCARGLLPHEAVFERVVASFDRIEALPDGVRLSGPAGAVVLRRPEGGRLANPFGNRPAPGPRLFWGHFRLVEAGGLAARGPIDLAVGGASIEARSGCVHWRWRRDPMGPDLGFAPDPAGLPVCERALSDVEQALERIVPHLRGIEWIAPYRLRLSGPAGAILLERVREAR